MKKMNSRNSRRGFTLIELLVVILILGVLAAVALPAYLSSVKESRHKTAKTNAKMIANAIQADFVKAERTSYATYSNAATTLANATVLAELGGAIPKNPCTNGATANDWTITGTTDGVTVSAVIGDGCETTADVTVVLGAAAAATGGGTGGN